MRILHVITSINRGGAENQLMYLVRLQRAAGHEVMVAYLREEGEWRDEMEGLGILVVDLDMRARRVLRSAYRLRREIRSFVPDIVNAHLQPAELCARLALLGTSRSSLPLVITKHNRKIFGRLPGQGMLARWTARRASAVISVSESVKALSDQIGISSSAGRSVTIHNAIDLAPYDGRSRERSRELRRTWGIPDQEVVIGTAGRLLPVKAFHVLMKAFAAYSKRAKHGARLVIVGRGPLRGELERLARSLEIEEKVIFPGFREDIPVVMGAFDVFALTSNSEGFPVAVMEAMAAGKPVVATRVGGVPELVLDGETGKLVPPCDPEAVTSALAFFDEAANRQAFAAAGRRRVLSEYSLERMLRETMAVYQECLGPKR